MRNAVRLKMALRGPVLVLLLGAIAVLVAACGSDPTATPRPTNTPLATIDPMTIIPDWQLEYDRVLELALAEGEVVIAMGGSASRNFGPRFEAFENETGIKVIAATGRGSQQVEKIRSEREAGLFTTDLWMTGITSTKGVNAVDALEHDFLDHFILPDILDVNNWMDGKHWFPNGLENTTMAFCASPNVQFAYNTDLVDPSTLDSYWDLVDGRFDGMIVGIIPWEPGQTNGEFWINVPELGTDFIDAFIINSNAEWVADGQQGVDLLAAGVKAIFMPTGNASDDIDDLAAQGLPVANHFGEGLAEGGVLGIGGTCSVSILKDAPHPNAQTIFLNWWYTAANLHATGGITNDHALRTDVSTNNLIPAYIRDPNIKYFFPEADPSIEPGNPGLAYARKIAEENGLR